MAGTYSLYVPHGTTLLALDEDGGESIVTFAETHGRSEAITLLVAWLDDQIKAFEVERQAQANRRAIRLVKSKHLVGPELAVGHDDRRS